MLNVELTAEEVKEQIKRIEEEARRRLRHLRALLRCIEDRDASIPKDEGEVE